MISDLDEAQEMTMNKEMRKSGFVSQQALNYIFLCIENIRIINASLLGIISIIDVKFKKNKTLLQHNKHKVKTSVHNRQ